MEEGELGACIICGSLQQDAEAPVGEREQSSSDGRAHPATPCRELALGVEHREHDEVREAHEDGSSHVVQLLHGGLPSP